MYPSSWDVRDRTTARARQIRASTACRGAPAGTARGTRRSEMASAAGVITDMAHRVSRGKGPDRSASVVVADLQHRQERLLGNLDLSELLHPLFAFALLGPEFALAGDIAAVTFGGHVLAQGG